MPLSLDGVDFDTMPPAVIQKILAMPAMEPPPGADTQIQPPDFKWYLLCVVLCMAISGIFIALRAYTKLVVVKQVDAADYFILIGFGFLLAEAFLSRLATKSGAGIHQWHVTVHQLMQLAYWMNICEIVYSPCIFFVKISVLLQYLKIFAPSRSSPNKTMFYGSWIIIITTGISYTFAVFYVTFRCTPRSFIWNKLQNGTCRPRDPPILYTAAFNILIDIAILLLPTVNLWKLQIDMRKKIQITCLFSMGFLATFASIIRIVYTVRIVKPNADISYLTLGLGLWSFAEIALVLIASSAMSLPKLLRAKSKEISQVLSFVRLPFSSIASFVASSGKDSKGDSILATAEEGKRRPGYESKEYIMKSMEFETKSEAAGSWHVDDAHEIRMA